MKIVDVNNIELTNPDLSLGYLIDDKIFIKHHKATEKVDEKWHYDVIKEYPNGGKDVKKVVDVVGIEAKKAWDEYENVQRYIKFTDEELDNIRKEKQEKLTTSQRLDKLEEMVQKIYKYFDNHQDTYNEQTKQNSLF